MRLPCLKLVRFRPLPWLAATLLLIAASVSAQQSPAPDRLAEAQRLVSAERQDSALPLLRSLLQDEPKNGRAWLLFGAAHRALGHLDSAAAGYTQALDLPRARPTALRALFGIAAQDRRPEDAYHWFQEIRATGRVDLTLLASDSSLAGLHDDPRFAELFADRISYEPPFVEPVRIIHEWRGEASGDEFGWIARPVGDVDGDRVDDVAVTAPQNPPFGAAGGLVYVYSGKSGALLWKQAGPKGALLGTSLEAAGDVNGDRVPDVIAGAPGIGAAFVYSGRDGRTLLELRGDSIDTDLGASVAGIGDFNHDGRADVIASSPSSNATGSGAGRVYIYSGRDGTRLLTLHGDSAGDAFGSTTGGGGGRYFIVGASGAGPNKTGRVYIYDRLTEQPKFIEEADSTGAAFGAMFVSVLGDVDGDGTPDIYATDFPNSANGPATGRAYVYSGKTGKNLRTLTGDTPGAGFGIGAGRTGDVDGDGRADLIVGAWQYRGAAWSGGRVTVYSGRDGHVLQTITGKVPGETLGFDAAGTGDVDGDGAIDYLITSAWSMVNGLRSGRTYIVAGCRPAKAGSPATACH